MSLDSQSDKLVADAVAQMASSKLTAQTAARMAEATKAHVAREIEPWAARISRLEMLLGALSMMGGTKEGLSEIRALRDRIAALELALQLKQERS